MTISARHPPARCSHHFTPIRNLQRHVLKRIFAARLVDGAIADSVEVMGWPQLAELADLTSGGGGAGPSSGGGGGGEGKGKGKGTKRKNGGKEGGEKKEKVPHALSTYTLFVTLAMDMISQDPENPAFKVRWLPSVLDMRSMPADTAYRHAQTQTQNQRAGAREAGRERPARQGAGAVLQDDRGVRTLVHAQRATEGGPPGCFQTGH